LRTLDEAAAYVRCHGDRTETILSVRPVPPTPAPALVARGLGRVSGEQLRRRFEQLLDARENS
jgi:hypothetical protein